MIFNKKKLINWNFFFSTPASRLKKIILLSPLQKKKIK